MKNLWRTNTSEKLRQGRIPPLYSIAELAVNLELSTTTMANFLRRPDAPKPVKMVWRRGAERKHYDLKEVRDWWDSLP